MKLRKLHFAAWFMLCLVINRPLAAAPYNYPGGLVELLIPKQSNELPEVRYGLQEPVIIDTGSHWRVLIGIELGTLPGEYVAYIKPSAKGSSAYSEKFQIEQKSYPLKTLREVLRTQINHSSFSDLDFSNSAQPVLPLRYPVDLAEQWSDSFGHLVPDADQKSMLALNYVSLTTTALAPVVAPQNAIVSKITVSDDQQSTIYLDHGRGLYSIITGLQDLSVNIGNGVVAGAVIGKLPTNQVDSSTQTLFWQCVLNGVHVNPIILTQL